MLSDKCSQPVVELELPVGVEAPSFARWHLAPMLDFRDDETRFKLELLVSELVTNAVRHSHAWVTDPISVRLASDGLRTRVEVSDPGRTDAIIRPIAQSARDAVGFGLRLLDRLADCWGVDQSNGTTVWFEVEHKPIVQRRAS